MRTAIHCLVLLLGGALLASAAGAASPESPPDNAERYFFGLYQEIALGDLSSALETYRQVAEGLEKETELGGSALLRMGLCCEKLGKREEALRCYNRVIADYSRFPSILEAASEGVVRLHAEPAPKKEEEAALAGLISEGMVKVAEGDAGEAQKVFKRAYNLDQDNPSLQRQLAAVCKDLGQIEEAIFYYRLAAASFEFRYDFAVNRELAECLEEGGHLDQAIRLWGSFLDNVRARPELQEKTRYELALLYEKLDAAGEEPPPGELFQLLNEGERLTRKGDYPAATGLYRLARDQYSRAHFPPQRLAFIYENFLGEPHIAIWYYKEALSKAPPVPAQRLRIRLAMLYYRRGDTEEGGRYLDQYFSREIRPQDVDPSVKEFVGSWEHRKKAKIRKK